VGRHYVVFPVRPGEPEGTAWEKVGQTGNENERESADKPGSVEGNHPSGTHVAVRLKRPTRKPLRAAGAGPMPRALPYLVLLQVGFAVPPSVATGAVRSYRTISPLPAGFRRHRRCTFCCTFRGLAPPRRYLAPCSAEPGLSSANCAAAAWPTPARIIRVARTRAVKDASRFDDSVRHGEGYSRPRRPTE